MSFTDDEGNAELLTSAPTWPVAARDLLPEAPTALTAASTATGVALSWQAAESDYPVTGYQILRKRPFYNFTIHVDNTGNTDTAYTDTSVEHNVQYRYQVKAINANGTGPGSDDVLIVYDDLYVTIPDAPSGLRAQKQQGSVLLTWDDPGDNSITGYQVLRRRPTECEPDLQVYEANTQSEDTSYADTGVEDGLRYIYQVRALNLSGESELSNFTALYYGESDDVIEGAPPAPIGVWAMSSKRGVFLKWTAPDDESITGYRILRRNKTECETQIMRVYERNTESTGVTYTDTDVVIGNEYEYQVVAINDVGAGERSNVESHRKGEAVFTIIVISDRVSLGSGNGRMEINISILHLDEDHDPDTLDYTFRGDVVVSGTDTDADACEGPGLGVAQEIHVVDEPITPLYATFGGSAECADGDYTINFVLRDAEGNQLEAGPLENTGTPGEITPPVMTKASVRRVSVKTQPEAAQANSGDEPVRVGSVTVEVTEDDTDPDDVTTSLTVTWRDAKDCSSEYNAYFATWLHGVPGTEELPDELQGYRIHLGSATSDASQITKSLSNVEPTPFGLAFEVEVYCGTYDSGRYVRGVYFSESILARPEPGTYSSEPGLTSLTVNQGTLTPEFDNHTIEYTVPDVPNASDQITVAAAAAKTGLTVGIIPWDAFYWVQICSPNPWECARPYEEEDVVPDADADTDGYQLALDEGKNRFIVVVWNEAASSTLPGEAVPYSLTVTRAPASTSQTRSTDGESHVARNSDADGSASSKDASTSEETASPELTVIMSSTFMTLTYNEALNEDSVPSKDNFTVTVNGAPATVSSVSISGSEVTLTLESEVTSEDTVTVSYTSPADTAALRIQDVSGNAAASFSDQDVETSAIDDEDGLANVSFSYQWLANDAEIAGATGSTYTLVDDDAGLTIKVKVSFFDYKNNQETLTSAATAAVAAAAPAPGPITGFTVVDASDQTVEGALALDDPDGGSFGIRADLESGATIGSMRLQLTGEKTHDQTENIKPYSLYGDSGGNLSGESLPVGEYTLTATAYSEARLGGNVLGTLKVSFSVTGPATQQPNTPAIGLPTISGTAQVGKTLTASASDIDDVDGMSGAVFSYQWLANDAEITGATSDTYTLVDADLDKAVKVRVIFDDDDDNEETLTSPATAAVAAETAVPDAPRSLNVSPDDTGTLDVSWEVPASDGGSDITGYKVQWKSGSEDYDRSAGSTRQAEITDPASRTHTITGLTDGVEYTVRVIAVNDEGDGPPSDEATATPRETTPPEFSTATVDGATLTLTYDEVLDENSEPSSDAFSVTVGGTGRAVDGVSVSSSSVILTLGSAVTSEDTVTVSYTVPTDAAAPRIRDLAGNAAASFSDQDVENNTPPPANTPATGAPTISGTAQVGKTLTASTSAIDDADGLDNVGYSYQWLANGADIAGATSSSYTLVETDNGKTIQVKVSFRDDKNNPETLTSAATAAVESRPNSPATGAPSISGTVRVGETLTAETSAIDDADGMSGAVFTYQWLANGADIAGATNNTYTLVDAELDKAVKVRAIFTDNADNEETLTSEATAAVAPRPNSPATGAPTISGTAQVGETLTVDTSGIDDADGMSGAVFSYQWLANGADVMGATSDTYTPVADDVGKAIKVKVSFRDDRNHQESLTSAATAAVTAAADDSSIWSATLTAGSSGSFHGYWKDLMGSLAPDGFNIDGSDYTVTSLNRYGDLMFAFVLDHALLGDFTLQVGDTTLRSEEAEVTTSSSSYSYQWQNKIPDLSDGDIVEVSLTASD